eukprot:Platyproteum_vivax@DN6749_c1_g1_i2.p1
MDEEKAKKPININKLLIGTVMQERRVVEHDVQLIKMFKNQLITEEHVKEAIPISQTKVTREPVIPSLDISNQGRNTGLTNLLIDNMERTRLIYNEYIRAWQVDYWFDTIPKTETFSELRYGDDAKEKATVFYRSVFPSSKARTRRKKESPVEVHIVAVTDRDGGSKRRRVSLDEDNEEYHHTGEHCDSCESQASITPLPKD